MNVIASWVLTCALVVWIGAILWQANVPKGLRPWLKKPTNEALALQIAVGTVASLFAVAAWFSDDNTWLGKFQTEATGIAITVVIVEIVTHRRAYLEEKHRVLEQIKSQSNDFAVDAARIAREKGWLRDGSLKGADLKGARLSGAMLRLANFHGTDLRAADLQKADMFLATLSEADLRLAKLQGAFLHSATLQNADLRGANLKDADLTGIFLVDAKYDHKTIWPYRFDPKSFGAIQVKHDKY